jgi:glycosyl hydrolase family 114
MQRKIVAMRSATSVVLVGLGLAACGDDGPPLTPPDGAPPPPWWQPKPGEAANWDIQLHSPFDITAQRTMYELDLFDIVPADTKVDYGDGTPVTVKAGALKTAIADLHAKKTIVVCRVGTGAIRLDDPDAVKFPGYETSPPDNPTPPKPGSVIGWNTNDPNSPKERYVDIRTDKRGLWSKLLDKRFGLAKMIGCDAIDPDKSEQLHVDGSTIKPGWDVDMATQISWDLEVAGKIHASAIQLSVGIHDGFFVADDTSILNAYDWALMERLVESLVCCDELRPYTLRGKAALEIEYMSQVSVQAACSAYAKGSVQDGLIKDDKLSSAFRADCRM